MDFERLLDKPILKNLRAMVATIHAFMFVSTVAATGAATIILALLAHVSRLVAVVLFVVAITVVTVASYAWYYVTHIYDPSFYEILELNGRLDVQRVGGHHRYIYERRQTVVAIRNSLRLIELRGHWTGQGQPKHIHVESIKHEHAMLDGGRAESNGYVHRWIYAHRALKRGQPIEIGIRQTHEDGLQEQLPYFREGGGRYKARRIIVVVRLLRAVRRERGGVVAGERGSR